MQCLKRNRNLVNPLEEGYDANITSLVLDHVCCCSPAEKSTVLWLFPSLYPRLLLPHHRSRRSSPDWLEPLLHVHFFQAVAPFNNLWFNRSWILFKDECDLVRWKKREIVFCIHYVHAWRINENDVRSSTRIERDLSNLSIVSDSKYSRFTIAIDTWRRERYEPLKLYWQMHVLLLRERRMNFNDTTRTRRWKICITKLKI